MAAMVLHSYKGFFESSCSTHFTKSKFRFKWTINDFHFYCKALGTKLVSSKFSDGTDTGLKWHLELASVPNSSLQQPHQSQLKQNNPSYCQYFSLYLYLDSTSVNPIKANCKFSVLNGKLKEVNESNIDHEFNGGNKFLSITQFVKNENLFNEESMLFLSNDELTILCEIVAAVKSENITNELTIPQCHVPNDLGLALLENPEFSDVTLCGGGRELRAHKAILSVRSEVFTAMFQPNTKESQTNRVDISDVDFDILEGMLHFIYTDKFASMEQVSKLLIAADKYRLERLKLRCEEALGKNLSTENAAECYIVANQVNAEQLKVLAKSFIMANAASVSKTTGFASLLQDYSTMAIEALSSIN